MKYLGLFPRYLIQLFADWLLVSGTFAFGTARARVGDPLPSQLIIKSLANNSSSPLNISQIIVAFDGGLKDIKIEHDPNEKPVASLNGQPTQFYAISLAESSSSVEVIALKSSSPKGNNLLCGLCNLTFYPGVSKVFNFSLLSRDAGEIKATTVLVSIQEELFDFNIAIAMSDLTSSKEWWMRRDSSLSTKKISTDRTWSIEILPKPPRIHIELPTLREFYYIDEQVIISIVVVNDEEEDVEAQIDVKIQGEFDKSPKLAWTTSSDDRNETLNNAPDKNADISGARLTDRSLGWLTPSTKRNETVAFTALPEMAECILEINVIYRLISDPDTPISKCVTKKLVFISPFEANFDFKPRVHPRPWPSYFSLPDEDVLSTSAEGQLSTGLEQLWSLATRIASCANESLLIECIELKIVDTRSGAVCKVLQDDVADVQTAVLGPNVILDRDFPFEVQKRSLEDRRSSIVSFGLCILWRRESSKDLLFNSTLSVPSITIPFGEPRVLATAYSSDFSGQYSLIHLSYIVENPSMHLLTFTLSMEASEDFAFSGPKAVTVQLVPLSRHAISYKLLPAQQGVWMWPVLKVVDVGFGKTLKVGAGEGCRGDGQGVGIWVHAKN